MTDASATDATGHSPADLAAVVFRDAAEADLAAIVALLADDDLGATRERAEDPLPACYREAFARMRAFGGHQLVVAETPAGEIVGCLQLMLLPGLARQGRPGRRSRRCASPGRCAAAASAPG